MSRDDWAGLPGRLIVVSGPSGSGKSTLIRAALSRQGVRARPSVSATTRAPRAGEEHGREYFFLTPDEFRAARDRDEFLEWAEYAGNLYGTPAGPVLEALREGWCVVLEIEVQGAAQVRASVPDALLAFIAVPTFEALERRLRSRGSESEDAVVRRLDRARQELAEAGMYDVKILNDEVERAVGELAELFLRHGCRGE